MWVSTRVLLAGRLAASIPEAADEAAAASPAATPAAAAAAAAAQVMLWDWLKAHLPGYVTHLGFTPADTTD
jgi:hypothetical protein